MSRPAASASVTSSSWMVRRSAFGRASRSVRAAPGRIVRMHEAPVGEQPLHEVEAVLASGTGDDGGRGWPGHTGRSGALDRCCSYQSIVAAQAVLERVVAVEAEALAGAARVERAPRLAVGLGRVPADLALEAGEARDQRRRARGS